MLDIKNAPPYFKRQPKNEQLLFCSEAMYKMDEKPDFASQIK